MDCAQRLKLRLCRDENKAISILQRIPEWPVSMKLDLQLDLFSMSIDAMESALECIALCGKALETLWLFKSGPLHYPDRLPSVLSVCRGLVSLQLELSPSAIGLCEILTSVGRDLVHLVYFHLHVKALLDTVERPTVAPCMLLAQDEHHRVLRVVFLDFPGIDLTDEAVALLVDAAVQRCEKNPRNVNTLKVEGSSVGVCSFAALSVWVTCGIFVFVWICM